MAAYVAVTATGDIDAVSAPAAVVQAAEPVTRVCIWLGPPFVHVTPENVTVPEGVPPPGAVGTTEAVKVIGCPDTDGDADDVTITRVLAAVVAPTLAAVAVVLPVKLVSPEYVALTEKGPVPPASWIEQVAVAVPPLPDRVAPVHDAGNVGVPPSVKLTVPVGVTAFPVTGLGLTVAVKVTVWPVTGVELDVATVVVLPPCTTVMLVEPELAE